nr:protein SINE3 isoform X1 [Tanacetum cinerariifolium]
MNDWQLFVIDDLSYIGSLNQFISPSPATPSPLTSPFSSTWHAESSPLSCITTAEMTPLSSPIIAEAVTICVPSHNGSTADEMNSLKVEVVKNLRESMFQVLHSADIEPRSKKVLDALVKMVIEELHEEKNIVVELFSNRIMIVLLSFVLGMLAVSAGLYVLSDVQGYDHGPPPT